jgi:hypothetical protein
MMKSPMYKQSEETVKDEPTPDLAEATFGGGSGV